MSQTQKCYVCGRSGLLCESRMIVDRPSEVLRVAQCPVCHRFICAGHGEKRVHSRDGQSVQVICCPFDPGILLGEELPLLQEDGSLDRLRVADRSPPRTASPASPEPVGPTEEQSTESTTQNRTQLLRHASELISRASALYEKEDLGGALALYQQVEPICQVLEDKPGLCSCWIQQARIFMVQEEGREKALQLFQQAELLARELKDSERLARALYARAGLLGLARNRPEVALPLLEEAADLAV